MKKNYLIILAAVALFASCYESDTFKGAVQEEKADQPLSFTAYADKVTRGSNSTALKDFYTVFGVYGWKTVAKTDGSGKENQPVFVNTPNEYFTADEQGDVVYNATGEKPSKEWSLANMFPGWYYKNIRYWDKLATEYQFFAIAPYDESATPVYTVTPSVPNATEAQKNNNFSIYSESSQYNIQTEYNLARTDLTADPIDEDAAPKNELVYNGFKKDYMIAEKKFATPKGTVTTTDVQLIFHHILTKLNVKIKKSDNYSGSQELKVNKLIIANLAKEANYVYSTDMATDGWAKKANSTYDISIETAYSLANNENDENYPDNYWVETLIFPQTTNCKAAGTQPTSDGLTGIYLYIQYQIGDEIFNAYYDLAFVFDPTKAPIAATAYTAAEAAAYNEEHNLTDPSDPDYKQEGSEKTAAVPGGDYEFKQGSQYNLTMIVGPDPIHFEATVSSWADVTKELPVD